jgi:Uma2 family endonuclease
MEALVQEAMKSEKFGLYWAQMRDAWEAEQRRRVAFLEKITENDKAEFINGEEIFHSPSRESHNAVLATLAELLSPYVRSRKLGRIRGEKAMISLTRNDYEPDLSFFSMEKIKKLDKNTMRYPAPDFVVEALSPSTAKNDRGVKLKDYAKHGIAEYWIIDPDEEILEQYILKSETYELILKSGSGNVRSRAIEGFEIPIRALFDDEAFDAAARSLSK